MADLYTGNVSVLFGNGDGTFQAAVNYPLSTGPTSVVVGDFNGDGKLDLAAAVGNLDGTGAEVAVLLGSGDGTFQYPVNYATGQGPFSVVVGDFNHDGKLDLATAYANGVSVLLGHGDGTFRAHVDYDTENSPVAVGVADFDADGTLDLIVANEYNVSELEQAAKQRPSHKNEQVGVTTVGRRIAEPED